MTPERGMNDTWTTAERHLNTVWTTHARRTPRAGIKPCVLTAPKVHSRRTGSFGAAAFALKVAPLSDQMPQQTKCEPSDAAIPDITSAKRSSHYYWLHILKKLGRNQTWNIQKLNFCFFVQSSNYTVHRRLTKETTNNTGRKSFLKFTSLQADKVYTHQTNWLEALRTSRMPEACRSRSGTKTAVSHS